MDKIMRVGAYIRVSTLEQATAGYSVPEQENRLKKYCEAKDWLLTKVYKDPGFSGSNLDRPGIQQLISDVEDGKIDTVLVYKLDRLSRSQKDTLQLIEDVFMANDVHFVSLNENFDTSTPFGRASIGILSVFAQLEREQIKERMAMGKVGRAKTGLFHGGGTIPFGYTYTDGKLHVNALESATITRIFDMYVSGMGPNKIAETLNFEGYKGKLKPWSHHTVSTVLRNDLYIGNISWKGQTYTGQHEPIIAEDLYYKVQQMIDHNQQDAVMFNKRPFQAKYMLTGLIYCKLCGARYGIQKTYRPHIHAYVRKYQCYSQRGSANMRKDINCDNKVYLAEDLEAYVLKQIQKLAFKPERIDKLRNRKNKVQPISQTEQIKSDIAAVNKQMTRLIDLYQNGTIDYAAINSRVDELNTRKSRLNNQLDKAKRQNVDDLNLTQIKLLLKQAPQIIAKGELADKRQLVHTLIKKIEIKQDTVNVYWTF